MEETTGSFSLHQLSQPNMSFLPQMLFSIKRNCSYGSKNSRCPPQPFKQTSSFLGCSRLARTPQDDEIISFKLLLLVGCIVSQMFILDLTFLSTCSSPSQIGWLARELWKITHPQTSKIDKHDLRRPFKYLHNILLEQFHKRQLFFFHHLLSLFSLSPLPLIRINPFSQNYRSSKVWISH